MSKDLEKEQHGAYARRFVLQQMHIFANIRHQLVLCNEEISSLQRFTF